ncbi:recombinase RecX [Leuconostoc pseudomesenteroides]|nr:recombinase RecX [Leuconostoc pseudomesenteroides]
MKIITKISVQKQAGRYNIDLDNQFAFCVSESVLIKYGLAKGRELDDDLIADIKLSDEVAKAMRVALNYLGHSLRTIKQVQQKMHDKEIPEQVQLQVISQLEAQHYLDDLNYAIHYVATKKTISPKGPIVIKMALKQAGVSDINIEEALATYTDEEQIIIVTQLAKKAAVTYKRESTRSKQQKIIAALAKKGFSFDIAQNVVSDLEAENDEQSEIENIQREADKLWRRYHRDDNSKRQFKTKKGLYAKGYPSDLIDSVLTNLVLEDD